MVQAACIWPGLRALARLETDRVAKQPPEHPLSDLERRRAKSSEHIVAASAAASFGTAALCVVLAVAALSIWGEPGAALLIGGLLYLSGAIVVTMAFNVPRNNAPAAVVPDSAEGESLWANLALEKPSGRAGLPTTRRACSV
jgi:hypothetical protein